jgi:hypothetical protein
MKNRILAIILALGILFTIAPVSQAAVVYRRTTRYSASRARYLRHKRNMRTAKRVGIGAAGGAAIGAIAGGGKGAGIGAAAGAVGGLLYDRHQRSRGR